MTHFINVSNHNSTKWSPEQHKAATDIGTIIDIPFPMVPATADTSEVRRIAHSIIDRVCEACNGDAENTTVMVMGETSVVFHAIKSLISRGFTVVVACSDRVVEESVQADGSTKKTAIFKFVQFREIA